MAETTSGITQEAESKGSVTFSVRLTEEQRDLLTRAAELRGWSPTNLLRTAALDKALHIVNTTSPNRFDFRGLAMKTAVQLFGRRKAYVLSRSDERIEAVVVENLANVPSWFTDDEPPAEVEPKAMSLDQLEQLTRAARVGGAEFLNMIVDACGSITGPDRRDLPEPIDPSTLQR
jgi:uncharacterized protein (DUF1778 family)